MKKILVIHNNYKSIGGEDIAVQSEISFLKKHYEVETLFFQNDNKNILVILISLLFGSNFQSNKKLEYAISNFKPDLAYVHNTWFKASLGIFKISKKNQIKTVLKIHNFRYHCTKSHSSKKHIGKNKCCEACGFDGAKYKIYNKYFNDSYLKSFFVNLYGKRYIKIINDDALAVILLTSFHKNFMKNNNSFNNQNSKVS